MSPAQSQSVSMERPSPTPVARVVHSLDCSRALSDAICEVVVGAGGSDGVAPFDLARTMVLVPGGSIVGPIERNLLARARHRGTPLIAPTIVTPLMLASRFVAPTLPVLSALGSRASWREAFEETILRSRRWRNASAVFWNGPENRHGNGPAIESRNRPRNGIPSWR